MSVSIVARRHDVNANQVFRWRQQLRAGVSGKSAVAGFIPMGIIDPPMSGKSAYQGVGMITIDLGNKICVRVDRDVDESALARVLAAIRRLS